MDPDMFDVARRRGSVLSGKLVTKKESMKEPLSACLRRRKSSLAPKSHRRGSVTKDDSADGGGAGGGAGSRTGSPGNITPRSANMSRRGSMEPEALEALRQLQLKNSKSYKTVSKPATENLGVALKMIKKRRSLFEHGENVCLSV